MQIKLGKSIKLLRVMADMNQEQLGSAAGITKNHVSLMENDHRDPSWSTLCKILEVTGASWEKFSELVGQYGVQR